MKNIVKLTMGTLIVLAVVGAGYWMSLHSTPEVQQTSGSAKSDRDVLYYRNPMGLPDTSPVPKKDAMGMDYVPVFEGGEDHSDGKQILLSTEKIQKLGVKSEEATRRVLDKKLRAVGRIEINERRTYTIAPKFEGWVEKLYVNTGGQPVSKGRRLFDVYSPELVSALREYELAAQGEASLKEAGEDARNSMKQLAAASLARLRNWDITDDQIRQMASERDRQNLTFFAPVTGIVLEKKAVQGMRFMPGEMLYQIADLSSVWVIADVAEQDIGAVKTGGKAQVDIAAYPGKHFKGKVDFIYPTLDTATRTVRVRVELANPNGLLKPAMFANVELAVSNAGKVLAVSTSAVIDSGTRQVLLVRLSEGRFEPRTVRLGSRSENYVEVLDGIAEGEQVVISANFLIDAESNLKAALGGLNPDNEMQNMKEEVQPIGEHSREHSGHEANDAVKQLRAAVVGHQAQGVLDEINADGSVNISHEAIKSLGWPGMNMDFKLANSSLVQGIQPGTAISFELVERKPGEYVITRIQTIPSKSHEGH